LLATLAVCTLGVLLRIETWEWSVILLASGLVLSLEALNGAIEKLADHLAPERHRTIGIVKDLCAGSVLIAAIFAGLLAVLIFLPHLLGGN
jgi:diacylglycerol kinase